MLMFSHARELVTARYGVATLPDGWQDSKAFCVALADPPLVDLVIYVQKKDGRIIEKPFATETNRLQGMAEVSDNPDLQPQ